MNYQEWLAIWLNSRKNKVKTSTIAIYSIMINKHLIPFLGHYEIEEITEDIIQEAIIFWSSRGNRKTKQGLSRKTVKELVALIKRTINSYCRKYKIPIPSFYELTYIEKSSKKNFETFTKQEQEIITKAIFRNLDLKKAGIALGLLAGMRIGEICALKWDNIDLENRVITVSNTLLRVYLPESTNKGKSTLYTEIPKTSNSYRTIPIGSTLLNILAPLAPSNMKGVYLLSNKTKPIEAKSLRSYYYRFLDSNNVKRLTFHSLRHTFAYKAISCGIDAPAISKILGHSSVSVTLNIYCHPQLDDLRSAIDLLDKKWL